MPSSLADVAKIDPQGYMQITDRTKDVIKSGGESRAACGRVRWRTGAGGVRAVRTHRMFTLFLDTQHTHAKSSA